MTLFICLDDNGGQMFNKRRQSRDREVSKDILASSAGKTLYMSPYSLPLFDGIQSENGNPVNIVSHENFLKLTDDNGCAFAENADFISCLEKTDRLIIYRWNRKYPRDVSPDFRPEDVFRLVNSTEFPGFSHEKITKEEYIKK